MDKEKIKKHFSKSAESYDRFARLQRRLGLDILRVLGKKIKPQKILDLGSGTGFLAYKLSKKYPRAQITALDIAPGMVHFSQKHRPAPNLLYKCMDIEKMRFRPHTFDLVVSNATLQWTDLLKVAKKVKEILAPKGEFIFTTFGPATLFELKEAFICAGKPSPVHLFPGLDKVVELLKRAGFTKIKIERALIKQPHKNAESLLRALKGLGALSAHAYGDVSLKRAKDLLKVIETYNRSGYRSATYEVFFCCLTGI